MFFENVWRVPSGNIDFVLCEIYQVCVPGLDSPTEHAVGYDLTNGNGRVCSPIQKIETNDIGLLTIHTRSGKIYTVIPKRPTEDQYADADYVWQAWKKINNVGSTGKEQLLTKTKIPQNYFKD